MYTERDLRIINYLAKFKVASTSTLTYLFFTGYSYAVKRLSLLVDRGDLNRARCLGDNYDYIYYIGRRPKQLVHKLSLTEFHRELSKIATKVLIKPGYTCGNIIADALVGFEINGKRYIAFVEVQTRNYAIDTEKYSRLLLSGKWQEKLPVFPLVIGITNQNVKAPSDYRLVHIKTDLNLDSLKEL